MKARYEKMKAKRPDIYRDIIEYTKLPIETIDRLCRREMLTYNEEWLAKPLPDEYWFYLTSRGCFWGNTVTIEVDGYPDILKKYLPKGGTVLDYAGGMGTLAFALSDAGYDVEYTELSAIEKDFARFRNFKRERKIKIIDIWEPLQKGRYDAIFSIDVLEHISDGSEVVRDKIIPSLKNGGYFVEVSFFQTTDAHPMHLPQGYEKLFLDVMSKEKMKLISKMDYIRIWQK